VRHGLSLVPFEFVLARLAGSDDAEQEHSEAYPEHAPAWAAPAAAGGDTKAWERRGRTPSLARAIAGCKMGTLILSEFTACSHVIPGALRTNPWREEECARVFIKSLRQPAHERQHWQEQQLAWCRHNTVFRWAENILTDMKMVRQTLLENGEDVARTSCVRVGLGKSSYKEMSSNILQVFICDMYVYICHIYVYLVSCTGTRKHTRTTHTQTHIHSGQRGELGIQPFQDVLPPP
jgi:hypothetical protein